MADDETDVAVVVVTYDALPWIEQCLESVRGVPTVVVDNGSSDGTVAFVRERFPEVRVIESENRGLAAGWNIGLRETESRYALILNADAWLVGDALSRLVEAADERPRAAVVGPRLSNPDGTLQRSVRGFPTLWRLATEYFFLRKLAPGTSALNAFYAGGFDHDEVREVEVVMGSCMLVRRDAVSEAGTLDEDFFLFSEETDWCYRFREAGWQVVFFPGAECVHVRGCLARRPPLPREPARAPAVHRQASGRSSGELCAPGAPRRPSPPRARVSRRSRRHLPRGRGLARVRRRGHAALGVNRVTLSTRKPRAFLGRRSRCGAGGHSTRGTGPQSLVPRASSGGGGAGRRPAGAAAGQGRA